jgi:hypothetical protein
MCCDLDRVPWRGVTGGTSPICATKPRHKPRRVEKCQPVAYNMVRRWTQQEIAVSFLDEMCEGSVVAIQADIDGVTIKILGEVVDGTDPMVVMGVHVSSSGVAANEIGMANLYTLAQRVMEVGDYDEIVVEGAVRTTGANPGHKPRPFRFTRNRDPAPERQPT